MTRSQHAPIRPVDVFHAVLRHPWRLILPVVAFSVAALAYALLRPVSWEATQALLVRDEAVGNTTRPGRFSHVEEMKTAQETVLELVKSRGVLAGALRNVGAPADYRDPAPWPSEGAVETFGQSVKLTPPKGAEFGKTEVFYLKVSSPDKQRAVELAAALCKELEAHFDELRVSKYQSVIDEMTNTVGLAQHDLDESTAALSAVERQAGRDLAELRTLNESPSSDSALRRMSNELEAELRTYRALVGSNLELLALLESAKDEPGRLLASPSRLLEAQPALRRLKDGLVDAQLRTATVLGTMSPEHPAAKSALAGEQEIGSHLREEIAIAIKGLQIDLRLAQERVAGLERNREDLQNRLAQLANIRAEYANLVAANRHRSDILKTAQQELSEAQAGQAAARKSSLITLIDRPDTGSKPAGPGKTTIVLGGFLAGVIFGLGILFLTIDLSGEPVVDQRSQPTFERARITAPGSVVPELATTEEEDAEQESVFAGSETLHWDSAASLPDVWAQVIGPDGHRVPDFAVDIFAPEAVTAPAVDFEQPAATAPLAPPAPTAVEPVTPAPVAAAASKVQPKPRSAPVAPGSMSLKRALQKLDGDAGVWN